MRSIPSDMSLELIKEYISLCNLFTLTVSASQIYYWTDYDQDVLYSSDWYKSKNVKFDMAQFSTGIEVDSLTLEIENIDKSFSTLALATDLRGKEFRIERAVLGKNLDVIGGSVLIFLGYLDAMQIDRRKARIDVFNHFIKWKTQFPRRTHSPSCPWIFKGTECAYAGAETWCDHSWERCGALANTLNYGGFRWISELIDKEIWWGRKPKMW